MQWFLTEIPKSPPGIYTLKYLGLDTFAAVHVCISNLTTSPGSQFEQGDNADLIVAGPERSAFRIEEEDGHYIVCVDSSLAAYNDINGHLSKISTVGREVLWTAEQPVAPQVDWTVSQVLYTVNL